MSAIDRFFRHWGPWDEQAGSWAHTLAFPALDTAMAAITWLGSIALLLPLALYAAWQMTQHKTIARPRFPLYALLANAAAAHALKLLIDRPRPTTFPALVDMPLDASFPSAHTMQITGFVLALLLTLPLKSARRIFAWVSGLGFIGIVGYSRIHLQVHFPSDVALGMLLASMITLILFWRGRTTP